METTGTIESFNIDFKQNQTILTLKLNSNEVKILINEVLNPIGYNLIVTPKEIDFVIDKLSTLISNVVNETLHDIK